MGSNFAIWQLYLQSDDGEASSDADFPYQVTIALIQAAICSAIACLTCANKYFSLCNKVVVTALVLFEFAVLVLGVGLYLAFREDNNEG